MQLTLLMMYGVYDNMKNIITLAVNILTSLFDKENFENNKSYHNVKHKFK